MNASRASIEDQAVTAHQRHFGFPPSVVASAPGRVNLIGEHTDYNDGFVLPAAIDRAIAVAVSEREDDRLFLCADPQSDHFIVSLDDLRPSDRRSWTDYPVGVAALLKKRGGPLRGANICVQGNVPRGAGLSSSAALELATAFALVELNGITIDPVELATLCQQAEHQFAHVQCGIMDQFISCLGRCAHALLIDCRSLAYVHVPLPGGLHILICDSGVRRSLANSEYNRRREECMQGMRELSAKIPGVRALRDVTATQVEEFSPALDPVLRKRCLHVTRENARVERSAKALLKGDLSEFGKLMYDSHLSLRRDFEVSCKELDLIVDICAESEGVYGARMTGAGFGGCAVALVKESSSPALIERLCREYPERSGKKPAVYICTADDGARARRLKG